jgi:hypothetical protein
MSAVLADLTWPDAELVAADAMLAVPMGSTEQRGPHLPLSTDTDIAVAIAGLLAQARPTVVVAPTLPFGSSGEHEEFAGTVSIGQEAVELAWSSSAARRRQRSGGSCSSTRTAATRSRLIERGGDSEARVATSARGHRARQATRAPGGPRPR